MERALSVEQFVAGPIGRWVMPAPTVLLWCANPTLCGGVIWGRPTPLETERSLVALGAYRHPEMARVFDVIHDARGLTGLDPSGLALIVGWCLERKSELSARVRVQFGISGATLAGLALAGMFPVFGMIYPVRLVPTRQEAFLALLGPTETISREVEAAVVEARGAPRELQELRTLLLAKPRDASLPAASRALSLSVRTLQRLLTEQGTTFRDELRNARFAAAQELLLHGTEKMHVVAQRVGLSGRALEQVVREKTGASPGELRKRVR